MIIILMILLHCLTVHRSLIPWVSHIEAHFWKRLSAAMPACQSHLKAVKGHLPGGQRGPSWPQHQGHSSSMVLPGWCWCHWKLESTNLGELPGNSTVPIVSPLFYSGAFIIIGQGYSYLSIRVSVSVWIVLSLAYAFLKGRDFYLLPHWI